MPFSKLVNSKPFDQNNITMVSATMEIEYDDEGRMLMRSSAETEDGRTIMTEDVWFAEAPSAEALAEVEETKLAVMDEPEDCPDC